jgi:hypothetical protein
VTFDPFGDFATRGLASALGLALLCASGGSQLAADEFVQIRGWDVHVVSPLKSLPKERLSKANDKTPKFTFYQAAASLTEACSLSISLQFNDFSGVTLRGAASEAEFRARAEGVRSIVTKEDVTSLQRYLVKPGSVLEATRQWFAWSTEFPDIAKKMPPYTPFRLVDGQEANAALFTMGEPNLERAVRAKITGGCTNVRNLDGLDLIYTFDPALCAFDNTLVTAEILRHFSASRAPNGSIDNHMECAEQIPSFVTALDTLLDENPRSLTTIDNFLDRFFPLKNCVPADVLASARKSRHFAGSTEKNGRTTVEFSGGPEGYKISFMIEKSGNSSWVTGWPVRPSL